MYSYCIIATWIWFVFIQYVIASCLLQDALKATWVAEKSVLLELKNEAERKYNEINEQVFTHLDAIVLGCDKMLILRIYIQVFYNVLPHKILIQGFERKDCGCKEVG